MLEVIRVLSLICTHQDRMDVMPINRNVSLFFLSIIYLYSVINHMDRRLWTHEVIHIQIQEDEAIIKLVEEYGNKKWTVIA